MLTMPLGPWMHRIPVIGGRRGDEADPPGLARLGPVADQLGGGAGLAGGPAAQQEPGAPVPLRGPLGGAGAMVHPEHSPGASPQALQPSGVPVPGGPVGDRRRRRGEGSFSRAGATRGGPQLREAEHGRPSSPARRAAGLGGEVVGDGHEGSWSGRRVRPGAGRTRRRPPGRAWRSCRRRRWRCRSGVLRCGRGPDCGSA